MGFIWLNRRLSALALTGFFFLAFTACQNQGTSKSAQDASTGTGNFPYGGASGATSANSVGGATVSPAGTGSLPPGRTNTLSSFGLGPNGSGTGSNDGGLPGILQGNPSEGGAVDPTNAAYIARAQAFIKAFCAAFAPGAISPMDAYIVSLYMRVLGRIPNRAEVNTWELSGLDRTGIAKGIIHSQESAQDRVWVYYRIFLHRPTEGAGMAYWVPELLVNGAPYFSKASSEAGIIGILASDEFFHRAGSTNHTYVQALYSLLLHRSADADRNSVYWDNLLNSGTSRVDVAKGVVTSKEFATDFVNEMYWGLLGRQGEPSGVEYWVNNLQAGNMTLDDVFAGFLGSDEYYQKGAMPVDQAATMACIQGQNLLN